MNYIAGRTTRKSFIVALLSSLGIAQSSAKLKRQRFYITVGHQNDRVNDCTVPAFECYGTDRLDAVANSGITVWTEEEWREARAAIGIDAWDQSAACRNMARGGGN